MSGSKKLVHLHNGILCSKNKEGMPTLCNSMDGTGEHYAKRNKPGGERQIPYDLTYKWNLINKTNKQQNKTRDMEIKNQLTVTRRQGDNRGKKGKGHVKEHVYKGPTDKDNEQEIEWGG